MKNVLKIAMLGFIMVCSQLTMPAAPNAPTKFDETTTSHISMHTPIAESATTAQPSMMSDGALLRGDAVLTGEVTIILPPVSFTVPAIVRKKLAMAPTAPAAKDQKTAAATPAPVFTHAPSNLIELTIQSTSDNNSSASSSPYHSGSKLLNPSRLQHNPSAAAAPVRITRSDSSPTAGIRMFTPLPQAAAAVATTATVASLPSMPVMRRSSSPAPRTASPFAICKCDGFSCMLTCGKCSCGPCCKSSAEDNGVMNFASIATAAAPTTKS